MSESKYKKINPKTNTIYRGDNLELMKAMPDECVDLCYIDPPFFTQKDYKNIWGDKESVLDWENTKLEGFFDTKDFFEKHVHNGEKGLTAYLVWMRSRLFEINRLLIPGGSFYCHLDYHAVHYIKVILDELFGYEQFQNEIVWKRKPGRGSTAENPKNYGNSSDSILLYVKSGSKHSFNSQYTANDEGYEEKYFRHVDESGRKYRIQNLGAPSPSPTLIYDFKGYKPPANGWAISLEKMKKWDKEGRIYYPKKKDGRLQRKSFLDELKGKPISNVWDDISHLSHHSKEKTGWPTQKPVALLERIIKSSSNEGDIVFDCFAGCGTSMHAAHKLKRKWIGIDISPTAMRVNKKRLEELNAKVTIVDERELELIESPKQKKAA